MSKPDITCNELKLHIRKIKNRRAPGPDNIKPDLLKIIGEDDYCIKELTHGMNNILDKKDKLPSTWTESKTVLIPKKNKPTVKDLRPITLTNATYKLFMGILKSKIEKHIREIRQDSEVQAGFTRHRRIADNLFILDYCVATSFKNRKEMYLISVDFAKAFDPIKRSTLIFALKKYKIHSQIIDVIAQIYSNDQTHIYFNNMFQCDIATQQTCRYEFVILSVLRNRESRHDVVSINCRDIQAKTQPDSSKILSIIVPTSEQNQHVPTVVTMFRNEHTYNIGTTLVTDQCRY